MKVFHTTEELRAALLRPDLTALLLLRAPSLGNTLRVTPRMPGEPVVPLPAPALPAAPPADTTQGLTLALDARRLLRAVRRPEAVGLPAEDVHPSVGDTGYRRLAVPRGRHAVAPTGANPCAGQTGG